MEMVCVCVYVSESSVAGTTTKCVIVFFSCSKEQEGNAEWKWRVCVYVSESSVAGTDSSCVSGE